MTKHSEKIVQQPRGNSGDPYTIANAQPTDGLHWTRPGNSPPSEASTVPPVQEIEEPSTFASPPCFMHELDPPEPRTLDRAELLDLLNQLLEGERAGARGVAEISKLPADPKTRATLRDIAKDEARFCAMLTRNIHLLGETPSVNLLGETPSVKRGSFYEKLAATKSSGSFADCLELLDRGQGWVVRKLRDAVPRISNRGLRADLNEMLQAHERNIERCAECIPRS